MRQTLLTPLGLVTQPSDSGQYPPGALATVHNMVIRNPGIVETLHAGTTWSTEDIAASTWYVRRLVDLGYIDGGGDPVLFALSETVAGGTFDTEWITADDKSSIPTPEVTGDTFSPGKFRVIKHRDYWFFTNDQGVFRFGGDPTSGVSAYVAGLPPPRSIELFSNYSPQVGQVLQDDETASWKFIYVRKDSDGAVVAIGPPSSPWRYGNVTGDAVNIGLSVAWNEDNAPLAGDIIEAYRTPAQAIDVDPGSTYYLAATHTITSTDISNGYAIVVDKTPSDGLGRELYTNPGQEGELAAKYRPAKAADVAMFNGHAFYIAEEEANSITVRVPGAWGGLTTDAELADGIGYRTPTCTASIGSDTLTSVSDVSGIVPGQYVNDGNFPAGTTVIDVPSGSSIQLSANAIANDTSTYQFEDRIEINGDVINVPTFSNVFDLANGLPSDNYAHIVADRPNLSWSAAPNQVGVALRIFAGKYADGVVTVRATNGQNYDPPLPEIDETATSGSYDPRNNRLRVSEKDQPEAVPNGAGNELLVGGGTLHRVIATTDVLYVFATDGLWRVSGAYPTWLVDQLDPRLTLAARDAVDVMGDVVYAYTNRGLVRIHSGGVVEELSEGVIGDELPGQPFEDTWDLQLACDQTEREIHVMFRSISKGWVFNAVTNRFTTTDYGTQDTPGNPRALVYLASESRLLWALKVTSGGANRLYYADTSNTDSAMSGASLVFQPIYGDGEPFNLKEWVDATYDLEVYASGLGVHPEFNGIDQSSYPAYLSSTGRTRVTTGIDLEACLAESIAPGLSVTHIVSGASVSRFRFHGMSMRWRLASEEGRQ